MAVEKRETLSNRGNYKMTGYSDSVRKMDESRKPTWMQQVGARLDRPTATETANEQSDNSNTTKKKSVAFADGKNSDELLSGGNSILMMLGAFLETIEAQIAIIAVIASDLWFTAMEIHLKDQQEIANYKLQLSSASLTSSNESTNSSLLMTITMRLVQSFTGFTLFFFLIELLILMMTFRSQFFTHMGYLMDSFVIIIALTMELVTQSKVSRFLGVLRVWRVIRLIKSLVDRERQAHQTTKDVLELEQTKLLQLRIEKRADEESLQREYRSRAALEQMLQTYKDEIDTLKEALNIAAQAVAEVSLSENTSKYEDEDMTEEAEAEQQCDLSASNHSEQVHPETQTDPSLLKATETPFDEQVDEDEMDFHDPVDSTDELAIN